MIETWRRHYNEVRPHSSLGYLRPFEFKKQCMSTSTPTGEASADDLAIADLRLVACHDAPSASRRPSWMGYDIGRRRSTLVVPERYTEILRRLEQPMVRTVRRTLGRLTSKAETTFCV
jgi:hypothetical protein